MMDVSVFTRKFKTSPVARSPLYLVLLPVFFIVHELHRHAGSVSLCQAGWLLLGIESAVAVVFGISLLLLRFPFKAALLCFVFLCYYLFFGFLQDGLRRLAYGTFWSQYRFLLPFGMLIVLAVYWSLKKSKSLYYRLRLYLNLLVPVLILVDALLITMDAFTGDSNRLMHGAPPQLSLAPDAAKPDIYFILPDQYAGETGLLEGMHFDNSDFTEALKQRGFQVLPASQSNYNLTPFSVASILNMDYLSEEWHKDHSLNIGYCYQLIRHSRVVSWLGHEGYEFINCSVFDFPGQPAHRYTAFLPYGAALLNKPTLSGRLQRDLRTALLEGKFDWGGARHRILYENLHFNDSMIGLTSQIAARRDSRPKFVYTHLMLPHFPYYFDSRGRPNSIEKLSSQKETQSRDYLEYLQYANGRLLRLIDDIRKNSSRPPIILLMSDHGFRQPEKIGDRRYDFSNLNALLLPPTDQKATYSIHSSVNAFRAVFNLCFHQQLPLLADSTINVRD